MVVHASESLSLSGSVLTIGGFDGVHQGHQELIRLTVARARDLGVPAVVYTFDPPPRCYLQNAPMLLPLVEKLRKLEQLGVNHVVLAHFNESYLTRSPERFIEELKALNPVEVWVGRNFRFGKDRQGDLDMLTSFFHVRVIDLVCCAGGKVISSSRIRSLIAAGQSEAATALMG